MTNPEHREQPDEGLGGLVRRVLSPGPAPEEQLEQLLSERRRQLDEQAARLDATISDLERREELLRDSRASVERMLRLGTSDLEARERELLDFLRELTDRETRVAEAEAELARRRQELGAVELKRAALERRERDVEAREERLAQLEATLAERTPPPPPLGERPAGAEHVELVFVPGLRYRLLELDLPGLVAGRTVDVEGEPYVVSRIGPSPLPGDRRRCAYLVRGPDGPSSTGNS